MLRARAAFARYRCTVTAGHLHRPTILWSVRRPIEGAIYHSQAIRRFIRMGPNRETAPDATTLLEFLRLPNANNLTERIITAINTLLAAKGLLLKKLQSWIRRPIRCSQPLPM